MADVIKGYCMKTKKKGVTMLKVTINKNGGRYNALGEDKDGNKMSVIMGEKAALAAVKSGHKKGTWTDEASGAKKKSAAPVAKKKAKVEEDEDEEEEEEEAPKKKKK